MRVRSNNNLFKMKYKLISRKSHKQSFYKLFLGLFIIAFIFSCNDVLLSAESGAGTKFNMSYVYFGSPVNYTSYVDSTKGSLNEISPNYFNLKGDGSLSISSSINSDFIDEMHERGIRVVPFLSNHWDRELGRKALNNRNALAEQIANAVVKYNLDGVNIDLENLNEEDRNNYTDFVRLLRQKMPAGKIIAVSVASNPWGITKGWQGSYDYAALGQYSDYLMIMAYDEHYDGGSAGPVASIKFVEDSIKYAIQRVPKEKIVLGIPFFGRIWKNGGGIAGQGISLNTAETLIAKYRGVVTFDYTSYSPKATITIKSGDEKPYIFGTKLEAGTYTIWYENEQSIKQKLILVKKYGIKGTGSWSLGQETKNTWDYYDLWLNGHYYTDAQGHWAVKSIITVANNKWMVGNGSNSFAPNKSLTRAEAATALVRAMRLLEKGGKKNTQEVAFSDISGHWAVNEIKIAAQYGIIVGRGDGTFGPDQAITREEVAVLMNRVISMQQGRNALASRSENTSGNNVIFIDVSAESCPWSYDAIIAMSGIGIIKGLPDGRFLPKNNTTRAEMAALLCRVMGN